MVFEIFPRGTIEKFKERGKFRIIENNMIRVRESVTKEYSENEDNYEFPSLTQYRSCKPYLFRRNVEDIANVVVPGRGHAFHVNISVYATIAIRDRDRARRN